MDEDVLAEEDALAVERLSRSLDDLLHDPPKKGNVVAVALAIVVANHVHHQPDPQGAYEAFGRMMQDMVKELQANQARENKARERRRRH